MRSNRRARSRRLLVQRLLAVIAVFVIGGVVLGLAFSGSPSRIAGGVEVAGVDVGGLTSGEATAKLQDRARAVANIPVTFSAEGHTWRLRPANLGIEADWSAAVKLAQEQGEGVPPLRGLRRVGIRFFGADVTPPTRVWQRALSFELARMSRAVGTPHRDAAIVLHGLKPQIVPGRIGRALDSKTAGMAIVQALVGFEREQPVPLPVVVDRPKATTPDLQPVVAQVNTALSHPIRMSLGRSSWWLPAGQLATLLDLPHDGARSLAIGGPAATGYFKRLAKGVGRPPRDASFRILPSGGVAVIPSRPGRVIDVPATRAHILSAALSPTGRGARVTVMSMAANRTTAEAKAMGITSRVGRYETIYGGDPNRIHNVQLVARLIDGTVIAPGATFSFNQATGARTAAKGFLEAPVIINGELTTGLGGGVCQVSTTVFNAAYEAGPEDHRPDEPRALHQPLPAGPRRDRQLPGRRPPLRQRHPALAAAPDVRRLVVARRRPLRHADPSPGGQPDEPAGRDRPAACEEDPRPCPLQGRDGGRRDRRALALHERASPGVRAVREAALRQHVVLDVPRRAEGRPRRDEAAGGEAASEEGAERRERAQRPHRRRRR